MVKRVSRKQGQKPKLVSTPGRKRKITTIQRNKKNQKISKTPKTTKTKRTKKNPSSRGISQESDNIFDVEEVIGCKTQNGKTFYLIKWFGYPRSESTWEPLENLANVHELIKRFERKREEGKDSGESKNTEDTNEIIEDGEEGKDIEEMVNRDIVDVENKSNSNIVNMSNMTRKRSAKRKERVCNKGSNKVSNMNEETMKAKENENNTNNNNTNKENINNKEINKERNSTKLSRRSITKRYGKMLRVMQVQKGKNGFLEAVIETIYNGSNKMIVMGCKELRKVNPEILLDFYESRISFYNKE